MFACPKHELHTYLPSLRVTNSLLPYAMKRVRIMRKEVSINDMSWSFGFRSEKSDPNQTTVSFYDRISDKRTPNYPVKKSLEAAVEQCFNVYCKDGSIIQDLDLCRVPKFLCERDGGLKLSVSRFQTYGVNVDDIDYFIRFMDLDKLERVHLTISRERDAPPEKEFGMLEKPVFINCKELYLKINIHRELPINSFFDLRNQTLVLEHDRLCVNDLQKLIENWKTSARPIGTTFCFVSYDGDVPITKMLNRSKLQYHFPVDVQCDSTEQIKGIGMKMDEHRNLVLYLGKHQIRTKTFSALKMEVMERGLEEKNEITRPCTSA
ncbi:hypothetical protein CRE_18118 [Caenorhabditis remanei]|uniref:F-box associated domain-containing protein n=1 Tax=Caenorhabditis remanei TaxID=31234 RepID=E3N362_CAERE|nr:hypothetical protein CRE_18118 [Caenorhabditis remanei]